MTQFKKFKTFDKFLDFIYSRGKSKKGSLFFKSSSKESQSQANDLPKIFELRVSWAHFRGKNVVMLVTSDVTLTSRVKNLEEISAYKS